MSDSNFVQSSFLGGEKSAYAQGHIDKPEYRASMNVCRNGYPIEEGAWLRRSGTRHVDTTRNGAPGRIIPFAFKQVLPYYMEFTDGHMRFISTLSAALPIRVVPGVDVTTPYTLGAWQTLRNVQAETRSILLHGSFQPRAVDVVTFPTASAYATFALSAISFIDGPYLDPPTGGSTLTPSAKTGTVTLTASSIAEINGGIGFQATDVGRLVRLLSEPTLWSVATAYVVGDSVIFNGAYFTCLVANTGQEPDIAIAYWAINTSAATWSWGTIATRISGTQVTLTIQGAALLYTAAIKTWRLGVYSDTTGWPTCGVYYEGRLWLSGAVPNRVDASKVNAILDMTPTAPDGTVADNNAINYIFDATDVNSIYWMIGDAIGIICGTEGGEWIVRASQLSDPITPTSIQAHRVTTYGSENIEPQHCQLAIAFVQRYGRALLEYFPDVFSGKYSAPTLNDDAKHLSKPGLAEIRYQQELVPMIWARCNDGSLIGATYERESLMSSQGPKFCAWHRHDLGSGRKVESIAVGPSPGGDMDHLVMVTNDVNSGVRHIEIMQNIFEVNTDIKFGWFLDDAIVPTSGTVSKAAGVTTMTLNGLAHLAGSTISVWAGGIDCGNFVVTTAGTVAVPVDVSAAALLQTNYLDSISSTTAYGTVGVALTLDATVHGLDNSIRTPKVLTVPIICGFTYTSQGQILRPDAMEQVRSPTGPGPAKPRRNHQYGMLLSGTQGISVGTDFVSTLHAAQFRNKRGDAYNLLQLFNGIYWDTIDDNYSFDGMIAWQISRPYPAALVWITGFMNTQDR